MWIICYVDDSHEISGIIFSEKENLKMMSAAVVIWHFLGLIINFVTLHTLSWNWTVVLFHFSCQILDGKYWW